MRYFIIVFLFFGSIGAAAQKQDPITLRSSALYNKNIVQIKPVYKNYIAQTAKAFKKSMLNVDSLETAMKVPGNNKFANLNNADVNMLVFLIMQLAQTEASDDIKALMATMEKNRQQKDALRKEEETIKAAQRKAKDSMKVKASTYNLYQARLQKLKDEKDALSEMDEQDTLQLQQLMEKKTQLEKMISNMMKVVEETGSGLSGAFKAS